MITIGFSTRKVDSTFVELLTKSCGIPSVQILPVENNGEFSLTQVYNKILDQSENDIVVLCHDDIYFDSKNKALFYKLINEHFAKNKVHVFITSPLI
jgi:isopentenyl phosphate kinase